MFVFNFHRAAASIQVLRAWDSSPQLSPVYLAASEYMVIGYVRDAVGSVTSARKNITVVSVQVSREPDRPALAVCGFTERTSRTANLTVLVLGGIEAKFCK